MHVNTRPGTYTTHHFIGTLFSYIPVKKNVTNSVETRMDPDQLVCIKTRQDICEDHSKWESAAGGVLAVASLKLLHICLISTYKYTSFFIKISAMHVLLLLSS